MSAQSKQRTNILTVLKNIFSSEPDIEEYNEDILPPELRAALEELDGKEKEIERPINVTTQKTKAGFAKKVDPKTEEAMRRMHNAVKENSNRTDREIGE